MGFSRQANRYVKPGQKLYFLTKKADSIYKQTHSPLGIPLYVSMPTVGGTYTFVAQPIPMKNQLSIKFLSGLLNIVACAVSVTFILYRHDWFGTGDVYAITFWTIPLVISLAVSGGTIVSVFKTNKFIFSIPIILIISSTISYFWVHFVFLVVGPLINAFSFPVFYLWTIGIFCQLTFLDRFIQRDKSKWVTGFMSFPLVLIGSVILMYCVSTIWSVLTRHATEVFIIPQNFKGKFRIVYNQKCGLDSRIENGKRIFDIPDNGILLIKSEFKTGIVDHEYYLQDNSGKKTQINELLTYDRSKPIAHAVLQGNAGTIDGKMPDGSLSTESPLAIHFTDFIVVNSNDTTSVSEAKQAGINQSLDSLTTMLVADCRKTASVYETAKYRRPIYYFRMR